MSDNAALPLLFLGVADPVPEQPSAEAVDWTRSDDLLVEVCFDELTDWVHWLTSTYALDPRFVPDCWMKHGSLLWELSTLHTAWLRAFRTPAPDNPLAPPTSWHQEFALARTRLKEWAGRSGCRVAGHRP